MWCPAFGVQRKKQMSAQSTQQNAIEVVEIPFHGDIIEGAMIDERPMVKVNRLCENLGINAYGLRQLLTNEAVVTVKVTLTVDAKGETRPTYFIDVKEIA